MALLTSNDSLFLALGLLQIMDVLTGLLSVHTHGIFDSKKLRAGVAKKIGDWLFIAAAFIASYILVKIGTLFPEFNLESSRALGWLVLVTTLYKESRSIFDNLQSLGVPIPKPFMSLLLLGEKEFDGALQLPDRDGSELSLQLNKSLDQLSDSDVVHIKVRK